MNETLYWLLSGLALGVVIALWLRQQRRQGRPAEDTQARETEDPADHPAEQQRLQDEEQARRDAAKQERLEHERADQERADRAHAEEQRQQAEAEAEATQRAEAQRRDEAEALAKQEAEEQAAAQREAVAREAAEREAAAREAAARQAAAREAAAREAAGREAAEQAAAAQREAAARAKAAPIVPTVPTAPKPASQTLIMVADDSKVARVKTGRLLTQHQYRVCYAADGNDAARQIEGEKPDLIITDNEMPGMDGFTLTKHIRANPATAHIPIIMITAADDRLREMAQASGVSVLLGKPFEDDALLERIHTAMGSAVRAH